MKHAMGYGGVGPHVYKTELKLSGELITIMNIINVVILVKILFSIFN